MLVPKNWAHDRILNFTVIEMTTNPDSPLVSTEWLSAHLDDPEVRIVDVRWRSRYENGRGISSDDHDGYLAGHIPGAVFAGMIADLSDPNHPIPDMLASADQFAAVMGRLGIGTDTRVIAYDDMGFPLGSARLWWALKYFGHERVSVLDGGLRQWLQEDRPLSIELPVVDPAEFLATPRQGSFYGSATDVGCLRPFWLAGWLGRRSHAARTDFSREPREIRNVLVLTGCRLD